MVTTARMFYTKYYVNEILLLFISVVFFVYNMFTFFIIVYNYTNLEHGIYYKIKTRHATINVVLS